MGTKYGNFISPISEVVLGNIYLFINNFEYALNLREMFLGIQAVEYATAIIDNKALLDGSVGFNNFTCAIMFRPDGHNSMQCSVRSGHKRECTDSYIKLRSPSTN